MAARTAGNRRMAQKRNYSGTRQMYVYGNVAAKPDYQPRYREPLPPQPKKVSRQVKNNRKQALHVSKAYVIFLSVAAMLMLLVCVNYVQLRSELTSRSKHITALQSQLTDMNEENTTKYNVIMDSVNLEEIRTKAMNEFGMVYANESQVIEYDNPTGDYIKQYEKIPEEGVLANSLDVQD